MASRAKHLLIILASSSVLLAYCVRGRAETPLGSAADLSDKMGGVLGVPSRRSTSRKCVYLQNRAVLSLRISYVKHTLNIP